MIKKFILITSIITIALNLFASAYAANVEIEAQKQTYDAKKGIMSFEGGVKVGFGNVTIKSPRAYMKSGKNSKPEEAVFIEGAQITKNAPGAQSTVKADIVRVSLLENLLKAQKNTTLTMVENQKPLVVITADEQDFDISDNTVTATGNVAINYKDLSSTSNSAKIQIDDQGKPAMVNLIGSARLIQGNNVLNASNFTYNPKTEELTASGSAYTQATLKDSTKVDIWADYQQYDKNTNTMITCGHVKLHYKDYVATGPKASFLSSGISGSPDKIVFLGRSRIKEGSRIVEANKIEITMNPKNFTAEGNVRSRFIQEGNSDDKSTKNHKKETKQINNKKTPEKFKQIQTIEFDKDSADTSAPVDTGKQ